MVNMLTCRNSSDSQRYRCGQWCTYLRTALRISKACPILLSGSAALLTTRPRPEGNLRCLAYSPCGRYFAWASPDKYDCMNTLFPSPANSSRVDIINTDTGAIISTLPAENVFELGFSPLGTYIITWQRSSKDENGDAVKNLKVWLVIDEKAAAEGVEKEAAARFVQKSQTGWNLQYTYDEEFCARVVTNEVQIYQSHDLTTVWNKIRVEGVSDFAVSPGKGHTIAVFVPERKVSCGGGFTIAIC